MISLKIVTALGIFFTALFTLDSALGGQLSNSLADLITDSNVFKPIVDYVSTLGTGVLNAFSHFDVFTLFSRDNLAFFIGIWALILIAKIISSFTAKG